MLSTKDAVIHPLTFEKVADYDLSTDSSEWNDEIIKYFYEQVPYLPKEMNSDIVVNNVDENKGYAKGSIIVWFNDKKINFPVIVNDFKLSPFDTFIYQDGNKSEYHPANLNNIKSILASSQIGTVDSRRSGSDGYNKDVKLPGDIQPKDTVPIDDVEVGMYGYPGVKMSSWAAHAKKEDLEKLAVQMKAEPDVASSFVDNSGDLITNVISMKDNETKTIKDSQKDGILDLDNVIDAKRAVTAIDFEMFDVSKLKPVEAPSVCELRMYEYPSMEDFMESGKSMASRFMATKIGKPITGIIIDYKDEYDFRNDRNEVESAYSSDTDADKLKKVRNKRSQIFISADGKYYSKYRDYNKTGIGFYGSEILNVPGAIEKVVKIIFEKTSDQFSLLNRDNRGDGADKSFVPNKNANQGMEMYSDNMPTAYSPSGNNLIAIYGAGDSYESIEFEGKYKRYIVNGAKIYVSNNTAIIPANVAAPQLVNSVEDPVYKMILGTGSKYIYLMPESIIIINTKFMKCLDKKDFMKPDLSVQKTYEDAAIKKVAVLVDPSRHGYCISGEPFESLQKIARLTDDSILSTKETLAALNIMGMEKEAANTVLKVALNRQLEKTALDKSVNIFGLRSDYINTKAFEGQEKQARIKDIYRQIADDLRKDLIKEASVLTDPDAVDVVLSLNYINEENLNMYIENIPTMNKIIGVLAQLLIASRMGLSDMNEGAIKKAMEGLDDVVSGLEDVKLAIGK